MNMRNDTAVQHRHYIESILSRCGSDALSDPVRHSWLRCLRHHSLDPLQPRQPPVIEQSDLQRRREQLGLAYAIVKAEMRRICEHMDMSFGMAFTDTDGVILKYAGATGFADAARRAGFMDGAIWSEVEQGTNGMGTCLVERKAITIEQQEHFLARNIGLTCYATPLRDGQGRLFGVLDISSLQRLSRAPMLALLTISAANIENRLLLAAAASDAHVLRFHRHHDCLDTNAEALLVFDDQGVIQGMNRTAMQLLDVESRESLCGTLLEAWLQVDVDRFVTGEHCAPLINRHGERVGYAQIVRAAQSRRAASVNANPSGAHPSGEMPRGAMGTPSSASGSMRQRVAEAERATLLRALEQCDWNVSAAARRLRIGRKTLYRKLQKHQLTRRNPGTSTK
jgi:transcriptional regulator of acetoin/glycerol metabolism